MEKKTIFLVTIAFITGLLIGFAISKFSQSDEQITPTITGEVVERNEYTYTTAICNNNKECIDVLVKCENGNVASLTPTSKLHEFDDDWEDFRNPQEQFCE